MVSTYLLLSLLLNFPAFSEPSSCGKQASKCSPPELIDFELESIIERTPKEALGFTQGLEFHGGIMYESTGAPDINGFRPGTKLNTISLDGKVTTIKDHGNKVFGEGLTVLKGRMYQLTWLNKRAFVYDLKGNQLLDTHYPREGWGLTNDGKKLISSDGSHRLSIFSPEDISKEVSENNQICVRQNIKNQMTGKISDVDVPALNELEYVDGKIYSNILMKDEIIRIDPKTGCVEAKANLSGLKRKLTKEQQKQIFSSHENVLNGIAFNKEDGKFYLTGKNWPVILKTKMVKKNSKPPASGNICDPTQSLCIKPKSTKTKK